MALPAHALQTVQVRLKLGSNEGHTTLEVETVFVHICHVAYFSHSIVMQGVIWANKCFVFKSKVPFITDRLQPNLHCLQRMRREYHVVLPPNPTAIVGEIGRKTVLTSGVRCPSLLTDFNVTCIVCSACTGSTMWYYSVSPLQS
jgi:hypothetical protein